MSNEQVELRAIYRAKWPALVAALSGIRKERRVSYPLLLDLDAHGYLEARVKLLVVGQQTNGWGGLWGDSLGADPIDHLCDEYARFHLAKGYYPSPFWQAAHELHHLLNPQAGEVGFAWSNVVKVDENGERPADDIEEATLNSFNVLPDEVAIARPHVVVFFTGPTYDAAITRAFPGVTFHQVDSSSPVSAWAAVEHPALLRCYRTYHPKYLRLSGQWDVLVKIADAFAASSPVMA